jgi:hypothetical protein
MPELQFRLFVDSICATLELGIILEEHDNKQVPTCATLALAIILELHDTTEVAPKTALMLHTQDMLVVAI